MTPAIALLTGMKRPAPRMFRGTTLPKMPSKPAANQSNRRAAFQPRALPMGYPEGLVSSNEMATSDISSQLKD
jgi:hypothetical protein